jgi:hypothetical protein
MKSASKLNHDNQNKLLKLTNGNKCLLKEQINTASNFYSKNVSSVYHYHPANSVCANFGLKRGISLS